MKKNFSLCLGLGLIVLISSKAYAGYLYGNVTVENGAYIINPTVTVMDAVNAEIVEVTQGSEKGYYQTGPLPDGRYKVYINGMTSRFCVVPGFITDEVPSPTFDGAQVFGVSGDIDVEASSSKYVEIECIFVHCLETRNGISGKVADSESLIGLDNIYVNLVDPINGFPIVLDKQLQTDENGFFITSFIGCGPVEVKVRFVDPANYYLSEFYGAGDYDDFSMGAVLDLSLYPDIKLTLSGQTPEDMIVDLIEEIELSLPTDVAESLTNNLEVSVNLLVDKNPNNDNAVCGMLKGFSNQLSGKVNSGAITQAEADALLESAKELHNLLECK